MPRAWLAVDAVVRMSPSLLFAEGGRAWLRTTITIKIMVANGSLPGKDNSRDIQHGGQAKLIGAWIRIKAVYYNKCRMRTDAEISFRPTMSASVD